MNNNDSVLINRRRLLQASIAAAAGGTLVGCDLSDGTTQSALLSDSLDDQITEQTLAEAEKLFGLNFSEEERRLMLGGTAIDSGPFRNQVEEIESWRGFNKPNALSPANVFDPRLPNVDYPEQENSVTLFTENSQALPDDSDSIAFASVKQQASWLDQGLITSLDLTEIYLARIARYAPRLECFITVTPELARAQARQADIELRQGQRRGPLHGIPYALKDLIDTADIATTWGANPYKQRVPEQDATIVKMLREAGAVLLGKAALGALAWDDVWFGGITRNPWNIEEGSSGSSAGSASATAAGLCSFAIGTETWGSIVSPSERCGTAGMRPTHGRVSRAGAMALCWSLDKIGPITRYIEDTALVLAVINGGDHEDAGSLQHGFSYNGNLDLSDLKVGFDPSWFDAKTARQADLDALDALQRSGVMLVETSLPELPWEIIKPLAGAEAAAAFEELTLSNKDDDLRRQMQNAWPNTFRQSRFFSAVDYIQCERLRRYIMQELHQAFSPMDAFFGPTHGHSLTALTNLTGHPAVIIRAGFAELKTRPRFEQEPMPADLQLHRVPHSVQLWGNLFEEGKLVTIARALEAQLNVAGQRPPLS